MRALLLLYCLLAAVLFLAHAEESAPLVARHDFTRTAQPAGWTPLHHISDAKPTPEGLALQISGADPCLDGPCVWGSGRATRNPSPRRWPGKKCTMSSGSPTPPNATAPSSSRSHSSASHPGLTPCRNVPQASCLPLATRVPFLY